MMELSNYGRTATMGLANDFAIQIAIDENYIVHYKYSNSDEIKEAKLEYLEDVENETGLAEEDILRPAFKTSNNVTFFIETFLLDNYPK